MHFILIHFKLLSMHAKEHVNFIERNANSDQTKTKITYSK